MKSVYYCLECHGFQAKGKVSNSKVALKIDLDDGKIAGKQSLITRIEVLTVPGALPFTIDETIYCTCSHFTTLKVHCSDNGLILRLYEH